MHRNQFKPDKAATKAAGFLCRYSYVSLRIHPSSDPPHQCIYLAGDDVGVAREKCFERDGRACTVCGSRIMLEMDHGGNTKISRCDCPENHSTKCRACHRKKHNREVQLRDLRKTDVRQV